MTTTPRETAAMALADELRSHRDAFLNHFSDPIPRAQAKNAFLQLCWDNKFEIIECLRKAAAPEGQWRDIQTVPRDGTRIILADDAGNVVTGYWGAIISHWGMFTGNRWQCDWQVGKGGEEPTKWHPLPQSSPVVPDQHAGANAGDGSAPPPLSALPLGECEPVVIQAYGGADTPVQCSMVREDGLRAKIMSALSVAFALGSTQEAHHKAWVIDQMVRALTGDTYADYVRRAQRGGDGPDTHAWDVGIAP